MAEDSAPLVPNLLIFAEGDAAEIGTLSSALSAKGFGVTCVSKVAQGLAAIIRRGPGAAPITHVLILTPISGLPPITIAKAVRNLSGQALLPLILVDQDCAGLAGCKNVSSPVEPEALCRALTPDVAPSVDSSTSPATPALSTQERLVLVVDDHDVNRYLMCHQVRKCGLPVTSCTNGKEALERLTQGDVGLILMDCQMPILDGYEATKAIRNDESQRGEHLPIIAVTAHTLLENQTRCRQVGMDDFIPKPIRQHDLQRVLSHWWRHPPAAAASAGAMFIPQAACDTAATDDEQLFNPTQLRLLEADTPGTSAMIIGLMLRDLQHCNIEFPNLLALPDLTPLAKAAHKLKGSSGSIGASHLMQACLALEHAARGGDRPASTTACDRAIVEIERLRQRLSANIHL
jgi:CheY-like chemotaxis protein/HPt (histidine-containing phosphotransfer) domain-containing protein